MRPQKALQLLLWGLYPVLIFTGLHYFEPRYVAMLLAALLLLRVRSGAGLLLAGLATTSRVVLALLVALIVAAAFTNQALLLKLYPAALSAGMLALFGLSLLSPPSMIERFARLQEPDLPADGVRYTRIVTQVWCGFFIFNGLISACTALWASQAIWALYNGLVSYLFMGLLFGGEWLVRRRVMARATRTR